MLKKKKQSIIEDLAKDQGFWRQILKKVGWNENVAEDVLQKTLLKVYEHLDKLRDMERLRPWVFQIMKNEALKTMYENQRKRTTLLSDSYETKEDDIELMQLLEKTLKMKSFYTEVERKAAKILISEGVAGVSSQEISRVICEQLVCEMNYVTSLLYRIRNKLNNYLQQQGYENCLRKRSNVRRCNAKNLVS